jgi:hypothetical protein
MIIILKNLFKLSLLIIIVTVLNVTASALLPYSQAFKTASENTDPSIIIYLLMNNAWICFTIFYVVRHSETGNIRLILCLGSTMFFIYAFMSQVETLFFRSAFTILTNTDIFLIAASNGILIFAGVPLGVILFRNKNKTQAKTVNPLLSGLYYKLPLIGITYLIVYFIFGYFVAWQVEDLRIFYSGNSEDNGFISSLISNYRENPVIYPLQFIRGVLFGVFVLPLIVLFNGNSKSLLISLILILVTPGISLIIPNFLFPDTVRWAHFTELMTSMLVFAVFVWIILDRLNLSNKKTGILTFSPN